MKKILCLTLALFLSLAALCSCGKKEDTPAGEDKGNVLESEHFTVDINLYNYFFVGTFNQFYQSYGQFASSLFDMTKPLSEQDCSRIGGEGYTWFDYFSDGTKDLLSTYVIMAEEAIAGGYTLSGQEQKDIDDQIEESESYAKENGYDDANGMLRAQYGDGVTVDTVRKAIELYTYAYNGRQALVKTFDTSDERIEEFVTENPDKAYVADFLVLRFGEDKSDASDEEKAAALEKNRSDAQAFADAAASEEDFLKKAEEYYRSAYTVVTDEEKKAMDSSETADVLSETELSSKVSACKNYNTAYNTASEAGKWIFGDGRAAGDKNVIADSATSMAEAYLIVTPSHRDNSTTVDVRHILIADDDDAKAKARAEELLAEWKTDPTEEHFASLATENTTDTASAADGGLYAGLTEGQTVTEFNDWCFDSARKAGDTDIVKTDFGYHFMYFVGKGVEVWKNNVITAIEDADYEEAYKKLSEKYKLSFNEDRIKTLASFTPQAG